MERRSVPNAILPAERGVFSAALASFQMAAVTCRPQHTRLPKETDQGGKNGSSKLSWRSSLLTSVAPAAEEELLFLPSNCKEMRCDIIYVAIFLHN